MKAGLNLDVLVAKEIFGIRKVFSSVYPVLIKAKGVNETNRLPEYSNNLSDAALVLDELGENGCQIFKYSDGSKISWVCHFEHNGGLTDEPKTKAESLPHAICLAALKTKNYDV